MLQLNAEDTTLYLTVLLNFGIPKYEGNSLDAAKDAAVSTGFECVVLKDQQLVFSWSPISGWLNHSAD